MTISRMMPRQVHQIIRSVGVVLGMVIPSSLSISTWILRQLGLVVSVSASHAIGCGFKLWPGHTKNLNKNGTNCLPAWHACVSIVV